MTAPAAPESPPRILDDPSHRLHAAVVAYRDMRFEQCIALLRERLAAAPDDAEAEALLAEPALLTGDFEAGLQHYEARWRLPGFQAQDRAFAQPRWDGAALGRQTLLISPEQGLGETVLFSRYALVIAHLHPEAHVVLEAPARALALLRHAFQNARRVRVVEALDRAGSDLPPFDLWAPLCSLPGLLGTRLETIPAAPAYLYPREARRAVGLGELAVGISWHTINPQNGTARSLPLVELARTLQQPGLRLVNLQYGDTRKDEKALLKREGIALLPPAKGKPHPADGDLLDFADAVAGCDLVVTIDNSLAHLAGALGRPTWLLLHQSPSWRWFLGREDSPWYPSLRLFRQPAAGDWATPLAALADAMRQRLC
jgi:ADP-heptose:LPS heptosyltransferase